MFLEFSRNRLAGAELPLGDSWFCVIFEFLKRNHLAAWPWPPGDTGVQPNSLGFVWTTWQWWTTSRRCGLFWLDSWVFGVLGDF